MSHNKIKFLWIDDETERIPNKGAKHKASDSFKQMPGIDNSSLFINVKNQSIWDTLNNQSLDGYDIILIDHVFGGTSEATLTGATVAEAIRDKVKNIPIIAVANEPRDIDIHKQTVYDDVIEFSRNISQQFDLFISLAEGYRLLRARPVDNVNGLLKLMKPPKDDYDRIIRIMPHELKVNTKDPGFVSQFYRWFKYRFTYKPGFLFDRQWTATILGVKVDSFGKIEKLFEEAKYKGIFDKTSSDLWWQSQVKDILFNKLPDEPSIFPWEVGPKLKGLTSKDISLCHVCKGRYPEIVAFTDETGKKSRPMHIKCTRPHDGYESALYFEDIRVMSGAQ